MRRNKRPDIPPLSSKLRSAQATGTLRQAVLALPCGPVTRAAVIVGVFGDDDVGLDDLVRLGMDAAAPVLATNWPARELTLSLARHPGAMSRALAVQP